MVRQISSKWLSNAQISCEIIQAFSASFKFSQQPGVLRLGPHPPAAAAAAARRAWAAAAMAAESGRRRGCVLVLGIVGLRSTISSGQRLDQALQALEGHTRSSALVAPGPPAKCRSPGAGGASKFGWTVEGLGLGGTEARWRSCTEARWRSVVTVWP